MKHNQKILLGITFAIVLALFILQHSLRLSWDFMAYVLNSEYLFYHGNYFELYRAPLTPIIIAAFHTFGRFLAEYLYIIFAAALHCFSCIRLGKKLGFNPLIYYWISLTPFLLVRGLAEGTELLSLALIQLALATLEEKKSAFFIGLAFLNHYANLIYTPILLFKKDMKQLVISAFILLMIVSPWLIYNHLTTGNPFTSLADSYALNVKFRDYLSQPFNFIHLLGALGYYLPFLIYGIYLKFKHKPEKAALIMAFLIAAALYSYSAVPLKSARYLIVLLIPVAYFTMASIASFANVKKLACTILVINLIISISLIAFTPIITLEKKSTYQNIELPDECAVLSNAWVHLNYFGITSQSAPWEQLLAYEVNQGSRIVLFKHIRDPQYPDAAFKSLPKIKENAQFIIFGNASLCRPPPQKVTATYIEKLKRVYKLGYNESFEVAIFGIKY